MRYFKVFIFVLLFSRSIFGNDLPEMRWEDKVRIKEAQNISKQFGDKIWEGISNVPFTILLVTDSIEFLINHPKPSDDFQLSEDDEFLNSKIYYRKSQFPKTSLATFPAVNGINCIVIGTPENTGKSSSKWIIILLHEHFHQYTFSYYDYYKKVYDLNLSGGDNTGMWMLNYPFPYNSFKVNEKYKKYLKAILKTIKSFDTDEFVENYSLYKKQRNNFKKLLSSSDYKYFSFQIWQEGIARYTEYKFLEYLGNKYKPSNELITLKDYIPFYELKEQLYTNEIENITEMNLQNAERASFYSVGFAEGLILDHLNPSWRKKYLTEKFFIENYSSKFK